MESTQTTQTIQSTPRPKPPPKPTNKHIYEEQKDDFVHKIVDIDYPNMDDYNKKAMDVMRTQGMSSAVKHMFTDQQTGRQLTYGEMRARYG